MNRRIKIGLDVVRAALRAFSDDERRAILVELARDAGAPPAAAGDERARVEAALAQVGGNITRAAGALGCSRRKLQLRMRALGMPVGSAGRKPKVI